MSELLKKQNYGVEVEFTGISRKMAAGAVAEIIGTTASRPDHTCYQTRTIQDSQGRKWKVMRDSSIHPIRKVGTENMDEYRVEFVTPILKYEDLDTLQAIIRKFREIGGVPHSSCGIHIHVDGANHTATSLRRLVNFMYSRQEIIYDALAVGDRKYRWCQPVCKNLLDTMKKDKNITTDSVEKIWYSPANDGYCGGINHQHYNSTRYHALNLHSFFQKGTVEFRLFNSTLHAGKIKAYVQFCLALSAWAIESDDKVVFRSMNGYTAQNLCIGFKCKLPHNAFKATKFCFFPLSRRRNLFRNHRIVFLIAERTSLFFSLDHYISEFKTHTVFSVFSNIPRFVLICSRHQASPALSSSSPRLFALVSASFFTAVLESTAFRKISTVLSSTVSLI